MFYSLWPQHHLQGAWTWTSDETHRWAKCVALSYITCIKGSTAQETETLDAWRQALQDYNGDDAGNVDENLNIQEKESELDRERSQTTEYPAQDFVTRSKAQHIIADDMEKSTSPWNAAVLEVLV